MGAQEPAFLLRGTVNLEQTGSPRHEHLSTGLYTLMDVVCIGCNSPMGWQYLEASQEVRNKIPTHVPAAVTCCACTQPWLSNSGHECFGADFGAAEGNSYWMIAHCDHHWLARLAAHVARCIAW